MDGSLAHKVLLQLATRSTSSGLRSGVTPSLSHHCFAAGRHSPPPKGAVLPPRVSAREGTLHEDGPAPFSAGCPARVGGPVSVELMSERNLRRNCDGTRPSSPSVLAPVAHVCAAGEAAGGVRPRFSLEPPGAEARESLVCHGCFQQARALPDTNLYRFDITFPPCRHQNISAMGPQRALRTSPCLFSCTE